MVDPSLIVDLAVASNVLLNVAINKQNNEEPDISNPDVSYNDLLYGLIGLNATVITILRSEGLADFQLRKEIRGYADQVEDLDALFFMRNSEGEFDPRTEDVLAGNPPEIIVAEIIAVIFGIFVQPGQNAVERFIHLQSKIFKDISAGV